VVGRVEVGAVVGADVGALDGGVFAVGELVDADAHVFGHRGGGFVVVEVFDLRQGVRRVAFDAGLERDRNVDQSPWHALSSAAKPEPVRMLPASP
jgi:hypothetical protein